MPATRRHVLSTILATVAAPITSALAGSEPYPVFPSDVRQVDYRFRRREVDFETHEPAGTVIVDGRHRYLYYVLGNGRAIRYGVGVGRKEAAWSGEAVIGRRAKWPTWTPTPEQRAKHKAFAKYANGMPGSAENPLGARALYLFKNGADTLYRIHGTPAPQSISHYASSGCIRMINVDVIDLYGRVNVGTRVVVLDDPSSRSTSVFDIFN
jgi:lipoprotein-anchoring transpeptidase ErfK/SrfK